MRGGRGPEPVQLDRARELLLELRGETVRSTELVRLAGERGLSSRTMARARAELGCRAELLAGIWHVIIPEGSSDNV